MAKRIISLILTCIISFSLIVPVLEVEAIILTSWDWNNTANTEGWIKNENIVDEAVLNGHYTLNIAGGDAYITSPQLSFESASYPKMELTYRNSTGDSNAQIFWTTSEGGWAPQRCRVFSCNAFYSCFL